MWLVQLKARKKPRGDDGGDVNWPNNGLDEQKTVEVVQRYDDKGVYMDHEVVKSMVNALGDNNDDRRP